MTDNAADQVRCPYCAELIQREAIKCKHCGEWLAERTAPPLPQPPPTTPPAPETPVRAEAESETAGKKETKPKRRSWSWLMAITGGIAGGITADMLVASLGLAFDVAWPIEPAFTLIGFVIGGLCVRLLPPKEGPPWRWGWTVTMVVVFVLPTALLGPRWLRTVVGSSPILAPLLFVAWPASLFQFSRKKEDRAATDNAQKRNGKG
ncbi:MAG: zinc ribbon domain-containing protein [Phycisphaerae bacterium]